MASTVRELTSDDALPPSDTRNAMLKRPSSSCSDRLSQDSAAIDVIRRVVRLGVSVLVNAGSWDWAWLPQHEAKM